MECPICKHKITNVRYLKMTHEVYYKCQTKNCSVEIWQELKENEEYIKEDD